MAPMSLRPLAVSPDPWAEGGGPHCGPQFIFRSSLSGGWEAQVRRSIDIAPDLCAIPLGAPGQQVNLVADV